MSLIEEYYGIVEAVPSISPTGFNTIKECALKALWSLNWKKPLLPQSPKATVGIVAHKLLAEAGQGLTQPDKDLIGVRWNQLIEEAQALMSYSTLEAHLVPLEHSVPDFEVRRIRTIERALSIVREMSTDQRWDGRHEAMPRFGHEVRVHSSDGVVKGIIDAVIWTERGAVVQDYKSGPIMESNGEDESELRESYQTQLKMYAALYAESRGEWPVSLELVPLSGQPREVLLDRSECLGLLDTAKATLQAMNSKILELPRESLPFSLANPSPSACYFCPYRPACNPYLVALAERNDEEWPKDVVGVLKNLRQLRNSKIMLQLETANGPVNIPSLSTGSRHPIMADVQNGNMVGVFNLRSVRGASSSYSESQLTTVYKLIN